MSDTTAVEEGISSLLHDLDALGFWLGDYHTSSHEPVLLKVCVGARLFAPGCRIFCFVWVGCGGGGGRSTGHWLRGMSDRGALAAWCCVVIGHSQDIVAGLQSLRASRNSVKDLSIPLPLLKCVGMLQPIFAVSSVRLFARAYFTCCTPLSLAFTDTSRSRRTTTRTCTFRSNSKL